MLISPLAIRGWIADHWSSVTWNLGPAFFACRLCGRQTFERALLNDVALELSEGTGDREEQPAVGRGECR